MSRYWQVYSGLCGTCLSCVTVPFVAIALRIASTGSDRVQRNVIRFRDSPVLKWFRTNVIGHVIKRQHRCTDDTPNSRTSVNRQDWKSARKVVWWITNRSHRWTNILFLSDLLAISFLIDAIIGSTILFMSLALASPVAWPSRVSIWVSTNSDVQQRSNTHVWNCSGLLEFVSGRRRRKAKYNCRYFRSVAQNV